MKKWEGIEKRLGIKLMYLVLWKLEGLFENVEEGLYWNITNCYYIGVVDGILELNDMKEWEGKWLESN